MGLGASELWALTSVVGASLLGSLHCTGMCGGLVAFYAGPAGGALWARHLAYHGSRLLVYLGMGVAAGFLGKGLNLAGELMTFQGTATLLAGAWMLTLGLYRLLTQLGVSVPSFLPQRSSSPAMRSGLLARGWRWVQGHPGVPAAGMIGLLTGLIPCGWLYLYVGVAAGAGSPGRGALVMGAFWLGTVPALAALGQLIARAALPVRRWLPILSSLLLVLAGLLTVGSRGLRAELAPVQFQQGVSQAEGLPSGAGGPVNHACGNP